jgi:hypothetical protein
MLKEKLLRGRKNGTIETHLLIGNSRQMMLELNSISSTLFQKNIDNTLEDFATRPNIYSVLLSPTAPRARQFPSQSPEEI